MLSQIYVTRWFSLNKFLTPQSLVNLAGKSMKKGKSVYRYLHVYIKKKQKTKQVLWTEGSFDLKLRFHHITVVNHCSDFPIWDICINKKFKAQGTQTGIFDVILCKLKHLKGTKGRPLVKSNLICPSDKLSWQPGCPILNINIQGNFRISQGYGSSDNLPENLV